MVEDPKQAVFIIRWESPEALAAFRLSALCRPFLRSLGRSEDDHNAPLTLRWNYGFLMTRNYDKLFGRITLNISASRSPAL
ncbi:hypothetical protein NUW58_g8012 [Xylaria curta]|uniref:Uncharacterized protein n=1 Tax=Xylaria curta TaxID=42375 RepID=A0ACC1ND60_9PEZI|nr:hypothetical protein NUW58_g8012 [Xylaria curta]